ncbi:MAG: adenylate/guanylate cyclase domain-containing protein [Opitutales bacterium]
MEREAASPKIGLSFRFKLMLAMLLVVASVSSLVLVVSQRQVSSSYREFLETQFAAQVNLFFRKQEARLAGIQAAIRDASLNPRLIAGLEVGSSRRVYEDLNVELFGLITRIVEDLPEGGMNAFMPFFRVLDTEGNLLPAPGGFAGQVPGQDEASLRRRFAPLGRTDPVSSGSREQSYRAGYQIFEYLDRSLLYEVIVNPVIDYAGRRWGTLVFGIPVISVEELLGAESGLVNGLLLNGSVYSDQIPPDLHERLAALPTRTSPTRPELSLGGEPHLAFANPLRSGPGFATAHLLSLYSLADLQRLIGNLQATVIGFAAVALIGGILLSATAAGNLTRPINALVRGTEAIRRGEYDRQLPVRSRDEIGRLTRAFNAMTKDLALKERYRNVLDRVSDPEVAQSLMGGNLELGGELRRVAVLFCDIRGFTPLSEGMDPTETVALLNRHMTELTQVVQKHHGVVDKFVGDEIMVIFGAPRSYGNDALDAVACARAMIAARDRLNRESGESVQIGIGIASGSALAGLMGSASRLNYTVIGPCVNIAARLCGQAGPMEVISDRTTWERSGNPARVVDKGPLSLKGVSRPVDVVSWSFSDDTQTPFS